MNSNTSLIRLAALAALSAATLSAGAATLSLVPSQASLQAGQTLQLDLRVSDLAPGEQVGVFDLDISFDPATFGFTSLSFGSALGVVGADAMDLGSGVSGATVHVGELSLLEDLSSQASAFTLATLSFNAVGAGTAAFGIGNVTLGDAFGNTLNAAVSGTSVNVTAVPEPASCALFGAGLAAVALWRRRAARA